MAKGSSSSPPITAAILTVAVAIVAAAIGYRSYQSRKPSRDDKEDDKNDHVGKESDEHTDLL